MVVSEDAPPDIQSCWSAYRREGADDHAPDRVIKVFRVARLAGGRLRAGYEGIPLRTLKALRGAFWLPESEKRAVG